MNNGPDLLQLLHLILHVDQQLGPALSHLGLTTYIVLFAVIFLEIGIPPLFFLPGDPLLFFCGAFCATGAVNIWLMIPLLFIAAVSGSALSYRIGYRLGRQVFARDYRWLDRSALQKTHAFYEHRGGAAFVVSPFIAVVRTFAPLVAGVSEMNFSKFLLCVSAGSALWIISLVAGGYFFGNIPVIRNHLSVIVLAGVGLGVGSLALGGLWKLYKKPSR